MSKNNQITKQFNFTIDAQVAEKAESIMRSADISPESLIKQLYSQISETGTIPFNPKSTVNNNVISKLTKASYERGQRVKTQKEIDAFFDDDGGY
ncbi:hypothetical protein AYR62_05465 [Secundilactobacillus paracollinoides]|uniref:Damage-inducible protein J n=1 Tax=Secundilactobacillus paracollinoides TaxID=240427 RepID=A0A1B2J0I4_9LACO|nr:hypothetical protein [Secundilactobacillus paracollinoides]ANZ63594.1 hypothetical protein AYR62_05465 [Secundilactobacillus paracollinoides]ANZ67854.1 hypothetical protein AYR63_12375 [Secundilactobacillus paracollinoides]KRL79264.1 hypothetical protein FC17_GL000529 [Secundilactobacillus paracollinoides DSM 15502 = JCM 11969]